MNRKLLVIMGSGLLRNTPSVLSITRFSSRAKLVLIQGETTTTGIIESQLIVISPVTAGMKIKFAVIQRLPPPVQLNTVLVKITSFIVTLLIVLVFNTENTPALNFRLLCLPAVCILIVGDCRIDQLVNIRCFSDRRN